MLAFTKKHLRHLENLQLAQKLQKDGFIAADAALDALEEKNVLYHPGILMRFFLFLVGIIGGAAAVGLWFYFFRDALQSSWRALSFVAGIGFLGFLEFFLIKRLKHFKSGLTEAILYAAVLLFVFSMADSLRSNEWLEAVMAAVICAIAAMRYTDAFLSALTLVILAFSFLLCVDEWGSAVARSVLPFFVLLFFVGSYFWFLRLEKTNNEPWQKPLFAAQAVSLLLAYLGGNYLVVRELHIELSGGAVLPGEDIPMAWIFYFLTVLMPMLYLYFGVKGRDRIRIWTGMITAGFSVFTFKYYYSFGHPEVTLTISGLLLLGLSIYLINRLKVPKKGITRDRLSSANLDFLTAEGILISQTLVGNAAIQEQQDDIFKGGKFGGGGASSDF